jgi:hypothetical protein
MTPVGLLPAQYPCAEHSSVLFIATEFQTLYTKQKQRCKRGLRPASLPEEAVDYATYIETLSSVLCNMRPKLV